MKKKLFFLAYLLFVLLGCSQDYSLVDDVNNPQLKRTAPVRWYGFQAVDEPQTRGVTDADKLWNVTTNPNINIKFINAPSDPELIDKIKTYARGWETYAGVLFNFVEESQIAPVRIAFDWRGNDYLTWSYTGNNALFVSDQAQPTAVFGGLEYLSEEELKGDVLRLFGQILGLEYEQRHGDWDESWWRKDNGGNYRAQALWESFFDGYDMDWDEIRQYVFDPMSSLRTEQTDEIDAESIMMWPHYTRVQVGNSAMLVANYELSEKDKEFIAMLYPREGCDWPTIQEAWVDAGYMVWRTRENSGDIWEEGMVALEPTQLGKQQTTLPDVCDGEQLTSANRMFYLCPKLKRAPMFNASNITDFTRMFDMCVALESVPLLDTSSGVNFEDFFWFCEKLREVPPLNTSNGVNFQGMFQNCQALVTVPLLDTSKGENFTSMFEHCRSLVTVPALNVVNGKNFQRMFAECFLLENLSPLYALNGENFNEMFQYCSSLVDVPPLYTPNGISFVSMFGLCQKLRHIQQLDVSSATDMRNILAGVNWIMTLNFKGLGRGMVSEEYANFQTWSFMISLESLEYIVDNGGYGAVPFTLTINDEAEPGVPASLIERARAKNIIIEFT
ncbi:MAG: BspA family leucine-rich repeat surface protein [Dysgonomonas sp.]|nr:BspA family leucine-rich repeat surface protein [Dysgonomonas sp.]